MNGKARTILFVCTGNTCRSPMAAALARDYLRNYAPEVSAFSAGLRAFPEVPASPQAQEIMLELGLDLASHQARLFSAALWSEADLILTMTAAQKEYLREEAYSSGAEALAGKVHLLKEYALAGEKGADAEGAADIADPFGQSTAHYRACAAELAHYIPRAIQRFLREVVEVKIALGADHGGYQLKEIIKEWLAQNKYDFHDYGTFTPESCAYPEIAFAVAQAVAGGQCRQGIIVCGTGIGVSIAANKVPGIRASLCHDVFSARAAREHNNANVLTLGERVLGPGLALAIVQTWLTASFQGGRHAERLALIKAWEDRPGQG